jgi:tetratricopeptide (TPR) repeat protein
MKKIVPTIYQFILCISLLEFSIVTRLSEAFSPTINEPNKEELESSSIQIGRTAIQLIQLGQNREAINLLKLGIKLNPKEKDLWISLAEAQIRSNKKNDALSSINEAIKLNPKEQNIYFTKASIYMDLNDPKKGKVSVEKGLSINKNNEKGYFLLGNCEIMLNNYKSALIAFKKSSKIKPNFWQAINNEGLLLYELDNLKEAINKFRLASEISNDAEPMLALAIALFSIDNKSIESIKLAKNALKSNPKYVSKKYQAKQLWGKKLQKFAQVLFRIKEMEKAVEEAKEKTQ